MFSYQNPNKKVINVPMLVVAVALMVAAGLAYHYRDQIKQKIGF